MRSERARVLRAAAASRRRLRQLGRGLALALLLAFALWPRAAAALQQSSRALPEGLTIVAWPGDPSLSRVVDAASSVPLETSEVLLVPVEPGDRVRVIGEPGLPPLLGLATGQGELPDVITWEPAAGNELRLPAWSSARFVAARVKEMKA